MTCGSRQQLGGEPCINTPSLGRHTEALALESSVLANRKRTLGDEHPDTLISTNNPCINIPSAWKAVFAN
ncbi:hypothetical protein DL96DRAFT_1580927 [Flagelloscypha sp. PMI_526]|nr:hypothetical protein DL96DRAFT_1580927 [Flagelloscypha sp. PMI_526]